MTTKIWRTGPQKMEPNGQVLQPAEIILYFVKKTADTLWQLWNDGMAFSGNIYRKYIWTTTISRVIYLNFARLIVSWQWVIQVVKAEGPLKIVWNYFHKVRMFIVEICQSLDNMVTRLHILLLSPRLLAISSRLLSLINTERLSTSIFVPVHC